MTRYLRQVPYDSIKSTDMLGRCGGEHDENLETLKSVDAIVEQFGLEVILLDGGKGGYYFTIKKKPLDNLDVPA